ncbi:PREDICTED: probable RNA helicase SDE3 [Prunus dulcis]|uniref:PREDICTED: probable RNA helicase SDE3 n=1 Tax=Prunus dulcis TaxID=3755 RepID=A0A5E4F6E0_PRUDU|nr:probable RNA helicase SDE3 isoform X1 [Prunus dulcis]VVA22211.1 PREDICTED: probable RNA helicase SDE3 [Prunus dulcis]
MSIFLEVLKCLFCIEDERENYDYNQIPRQTYDSKISDRNRSPPLTSTNQSPAFYNYKAPSPPSQPVKSPFSSSSSSPKPPTSSSKPLQSSYISTSSPSPKFPTSSSSSTFPKPPTSSSKLPQSTFVNPSSSNASPFILEFPTSVSKLQQSSSVDQRSALPKPPTSSSKLPQSTLVSPSSPFLQLRTPSYRPSPPILSTSSSKPPQASSKSHSSSPNPPTSSKPSPSSGPPASPTTLPPIFKQVLSPASSDVINEKGKKSYVSVEKGSLPIFTIPEDFKDLIKNDIVPKVLKQPLSPTTYKDYFAALLYAEEFYHEKWADFNMKNVTLKLQKASVYKNLDKEEKTFVEFMIDSVPENRPFLLSRDLVYVRPSGTNAERFQGIINRIIRSNLVLVEFEDEFYDYHYSTQKYDVSFSFNRVCLKRAHQAVQTASDTLFQNFLFPDGVSRTSIPIAPALLSGHHKLDAKQLSAVRQILSIKGSPPYLVAGQLCVERIKGSPRYLVAGQLCVERNVFRPSRTGAVVCEAVHQLCQTSLKNRILICAPSNRCCDGIMRSLLKVIPESDMFRANAAFREKDEVPDDILPSCLYEDPYFSCPPTEKLKKFRVIFSTLMSSFRLHDKGLTSGHFSHIFLVDASSAIEPETAVALTNFAEKSTTVIVTGQPGDNSRWVRADMARRRGLKISYFERLFKSKAI